MEIKEKYFEDKAKEILEQHDCELIKMRSDCRILWKNSIGTLLEDDLFVLSNMSDAAWEYWKRA